MTLENVRVVEMGQAFAGPWTAEILANLGAGVKKSRGPDQVMKPVVGVRRFGARMPPSFMRSTATKTLLRST